MPDTAQFEVGEQVLCFDGSLVYEAKIEKLQQKAAQFWYFIHYKNWKRSWDEWVPEENLFKYSEENLVYQRNILQKHEASLAKKHLSRYYLAKASEKLKVENVEEKLPPSEDGGKIPKKPKALATSSPTSTSSVLSSSPVATTQGNQRPRKRAPSSPRKPSASSSVSTAGRASSLIPLSPRKASVSVSPVISTAKATAGAKKKVSSPGKSKTSPSSSTSPVIKPCFVNLSQQKEGTPRRPHISVFEVNMDLSMEKTLQGMAVAFQKDKNRGGSLTAESPPILARTNSAPVSKFSSSPPLSAASRAASFLVEPSLSFAAIPDQAKSSVSDVVNAGQASDYTRGSPARETSEDRAKRETTPTPRSDVSLSSNASFEMAGKLRRGASAAKNLLDGKSRAKRGLSPRSESPDSPNSSVSATSSKALPDFSPSIVSQVFKPEDMPTMIPTETAGRRVAVKKSPKKKLPKSQGKKSSKKRLIAAKSRVGSSPKGSLKQSLLTTHPNEICEQRGNSAPPFVQTAAPPVVEASADPVVETSTPVTSDVDQSAENDEESKRTDDDDVHLLDRVDKEKPAAPPRVRFESDKETDTDSASVYLPRTAKKRKVAFKPFVVESIKLPSNRRGQVRRDDSDDSGDDDSDIECLFALTDPIADLAPTLLKAEMSGEKALKEKKKRGRKKNFGSSEGDATEDEAPRNHFLEEDEDAAPYICPLGLTFPVKLREVLYDDWYKIRVEMMLQMGAPAYTVEDILKEFELYACADFPVKSRKWKDTKQAVQLFKEIFDGVFPKKFLFTFEKPYHGQKFKRDPTLAASRHYGGCALVRFLSKIGKVMCFSLTRVPNKREALAKLLQDLITFVSDRTDRYCTFQEYYIAPPAYMRMYLPPGEDGETRFYGGGITR